MVSDNDDKGEKKQGGLKRRKQKKGEKKNMPYQSEQKWTDKAQPSPGRKGGVKI